ncbi:musculin [Parasteatoda tepidariorum]|uniref:musculin n=1 Tax=Parasteatoda tepidariorum TaxID=114398 RepID=UPI00077FCD9A|nr:musculin [Parasteatoda tepidariorum]
MVKRRRNSAILMQDEDTNDFDSFFLSSPHQHSSCGSSPEKPVQRNAANARERARMRVLSKAFTRLKTSLPWVPPDTKLSKLDTLRLATTYIAHLRKILREDDSGSNDQASNHSKKDGRPITFTWPFIVNNRLNSSNSSTTSNNSVHTDMTENLQNMTEAMYHSYPSCDYMPYHDQDRRDLVGPYLL